MKSYIALKGVLIPPYCWWTTIHISNQHNEAHQRKSESNKQNFPESFLRGVQLRRQDLGAKISIMTLERRKGLWIVHCMWFLSMIEKKVETSKNVMYKNVPPAMPWSHGNQHHDTTDDDNGDDDDIIYFSQVLLLKQKDLRINSLRDPFVQSCPLPGSGCSQWLPSSQFWSLLH